MEAARRFIEGLTLPPTAQTQTPTSTPGVKINQGSQRTPAKAVKSRFSNFMPSARRLQTQASAIFRRHMPSPIRRRFPPSSNRGLKTPRSTKTTFVTKLAMHEATANASAKTNIPFKVIERPTNPFKSPLSALKCTFKTPVKSSAKSTTESSPPKQPSPSSLPEKMTKSPVRGEKSPAKEETTAQKTPDSGSEKKIDSDSTQPSEEASKSPSITKSVKGALESVKTAFTHNSFGLFGKTRSPTPRHDHFPPPPPTNTTQTGHDHRHDHRHRHHHHHGRWHRCLRPRRAEEGRARDGDDDDDEFEKEALQMIAGVACCVLVAGAIVIAIVSLIVMMSVQDDLVELKVSASDQRNKNIATRDSKKPEGARGPPPSQPFDVGSFRVGGLNYPGLNRESLGKGLAGFESDQDRHPPPHFPPDLGLHDTLDNSKDRHQQQKLHQIPGIRVEDTHSRYGHDADSILSEALKRHEGSSKHRDVNAKHDKRMLGSKKRKNHPAQTQPSDHQDSSKIALERLLDLLIKERLIKSLEAAPAQSAHQSSVMDSMFNSSTSRQPLSSSSKGQGETTSERTKSKSQTTSNSASPQSIKLSSTLPRHSKKLSAGRHENEIDEMNKSLADQLKKLEKRMVELGYDSPDLDRFLVEIKRQALEEKDFKFDRLNEIRRRR